MKPSVILGAVGLSLLFACSANSGDDKGSNNGSGASSSTGSTTNTGSGAMPNLGIAGSIMLGDMAGTAGSGAVVENGECAQKNFVLSSKPAECCWCSTAPSR